MKDIIDILQDVSAADVRSRVVDFYRFTPILAVLLVGWGVVARTRRRRGRPRTAPVPWELVWLCWAIESNLAFLDALSFLSFEELWPSFASLPVALAFPAVTTLVCLALAPDAASRQGVRVVLPAVAVVLLDLAFVCGCAGSSLPRGNAWQGVRLSRAVDQSWHAPLETAPADLQGFLDAISDPLKRARPPSTNGQRKEKPVAGPGGS